MQSRTSRENLSASYALIAIPLVALITFVVGYTASRATLEQTQNQNAVSEDYNLVIPHEASMWSDFAR
ncbi:MAG: hypothetical protein HC939_00970 [Pleurocapsa sp. SU_5_0]|jgi:hypothetical protein|nr:hypothetical protein [Pleurocapsa sp. SU_5_0]NJO95405.1 hypothetical protein [Pleurocapsa sp. CRU_1_2]NJR44574.1 hypothetical protein [Hyellaceae cyanobacterium CSU_1_1]